jgi:hypothetical protein
MSELEIITEKYELIVSASNQKRAYYHLNSVRNFIIHYNNFASQNEKSMMADLLNNYLDFITTKDEITQQEAKNIFHEYIQPIGLFYTKRLNFNLYTSPSTYIIFIIFSFITFFILKFSLVVYIVTLLLLLVFYLPSYLKLRKNKVYGFNF